MSKQFVRGSQIWFHFVHMFVQSVKKIAIISAVIAIIAGASALVKNSNHYIFNPVLAFKYCYAQFTTSIHFEKRVEFVDIYNQKIITTNFQYIKWYQTSIIPELKKQTREALEKGFDWFLGTSLGIVVVLYLKGKKQDKDKYLRGIKLVGVMKLKWMIFWYNVFRRKFNPYKLANISYPKNTEFQHTIITGASGTGKTQVMIDLLAQIRAKGDKAIIYDKMGVYIRKFYNQERDIILNPFDARSKYWDFFAEGNQKSDFDIMAGSLIEERASQSDPFWSRSAKTVLTESAFKLSKSNKANNQELCRLVLKSSTKEFVKFLKNTEAESIIDTKADKTSASIRSVLSTYINPLKFLTNQDNKKSFSIRNWVKDGNSDSFLFLSSIADKHESLKPILSLWLDLSLNALLSQEQQEQYKWQNKNKTRRIWFIIDELPSLQRLPALTYGLAESRQFGGSFVISMQLMAQLREIYGRDGAESISGLCRNRITFATPDQDTASWCSENLGKKEIISSKENISFGANEFRDGVNLSPERLQENIVIPSEIMNLKDLQFYIKLSNGFPVAKSKIKYQNLPDLAKKIEEKIMIEQELIAVEDFEDLPEKDNFDSSDDKEIFDDQPEENQPKTKQCQLSKKIFN
jgi:type IV conjugative transfer system coupling protein TraD